MSRSFDLAATIRAPGRLNRRWVSDVFFPFWSAKASHFVPEVLFVFGSSRRPSSDWRPAWGTLANVIERSCAHFVRPICLRSFLG